MIMDKPSMSVTLLVFLMNFPFFGHTLFEYVCDEKQLYRPYVHIYKERRSTRVLDLGPGFHDLGEYMNVYVCINGIAYLYFSKNTELGEVYEAPQLKKYAHTCEMYNVAPREGSASIVEVQLHLRAILLLGDPVDYRRPSIQKFTAPYYFRKDQLNPRLPNDTEYVQTPSMYINASSMVIIGQSECTLSKGSKNTLIKVRPHVFEVSTNGTEGYLCKIGFQSLLDRATTPSKGPIPSDEDRAPALAMINDEAIRVDNCVASPTFDSSGVNEKFTEISEGIDAVKSEYEDKKDEHLEKYNGLVDAVLTPLKNEKEKLEAKREDNKTKERDFKKIDKQLAKVELKIKFEEDKKAAFSNALEAISKELANLTNIREEAKPDGTKASAAKSDREKAEQAKSEWESLKDQKPPAQQTDIDAKKQAYDEARKTAKNSAREYQWVASELEVRYLRLNKQVEKVKRLSAYMPSTLSTNKGKKTTTTVNPDGAMSTIIAANEEDCEKLPVLEGEDGECMKGKPDKNDSCSLFQTTLGVYDPWSDDANPPRNDTWKKEVLQLIGDIFSTACDKIRNVKKFVKINNRIMKYYLTNEKLFNLKPNLTTDTCINFKFSKTLRMLDGSSNSQIANLTFLEEKRFWSTIKYVLHECKMQGRRLSFKEDGTGSGLYKFLKNFGTDHEEVLEVLFHQEQADIEYSYNWSIDMNWKMFVTVMGLCMPSYEKTVPLITSRFFSLYTEYFLIPLRETWTNPKDNIIFQFVLGEFYNAHTEYWGDMCMESSFIYAGQRDYRPPRSLMVNCASEHNYFVNGEFSKGGKSKI